MLIGDMRDYSALAMTRRDEPDCIALDEVAPYAVHTSNDVFIRSLHIAHSTDCHSVLFITLDCVHCTREGCGKELTILHCPIVYPVWARENITMLQMRVSWSEQCPWSSRETLKAAVR